MERFNVGIFIDTFYPMVDGVIQVVNNVATLLQEKCNITVFTIKPANKNKQDNREYNYNVVRCKSKNVFFFDYDMPVPRLDKKFIKTLNDSKLDIVYLHSPMAIGKCAVRYAKKHNIPIISHLHSQYKRDFYKSTHSRLLTKILLKNIMNVFNKSDCAIAVNEFTRDLFTKEYGLTCPTRVIYNATDMMPVNDEKQAREEINKDYNLTDDEKIFTFVGRINKLKNLSFIFESLVCLKKKMTNFKFLLVGSGNDMDHFKKMVKTLNLEENVIFAGRIMGKDKLEKIYSRSDLLLFSSFYDTDGLIRFEAGAQGTPTVLVEGMGPASSIVDNETGFVSKNDPQSFADKIYTAMTDEELYKKVSKNARTKVYRTWKDKSANEIFELLKEFIVQSLP